jgi:hypothetical protein
MHASVRREALAPRVARSGYETTRTRTRTRSPETSRQSGPATKVGLTSTPRATGHPVLGFSSIICLGCLAGEAALCCNHLLSQGQRVFPIGHVGAPLPSANKAVCLKVSSDHALLVPSGLFHSPNKATTINWLNTSFDLFRHNLAWMPWRAFAHHSLFSLTFRDS